MSMATPSDSSQQQFQRLKVEDALSYLDKVKMQFGNQPQVYNDFLDIMKEFKSQSIDTPGVINRVSTLFKGHPDLIVGFNTFLPPGFKIEISSTGATTIQHVPIPPSVGASGNAFPGPIHLPAAVGVTPKSSPSHHASMVAAAAAVAAVAVGPQPVEFNQAVSYVNKIRSRFQNQPDIYKAFLEILHTYQKEQRIIKEGGTAGPGFLTENEVYARVSELFKDEDDLLAEFGQFLPDCTAQFSGLLPMPKPSYPIPSHSRRQSGPGPSNGKAVKSGQVRKPSSHSSASSQAQPPAKKAKATTKDILAEAGKHSFAEQAMFDKIRKTLKGPELYDNFLRCLYLFNEEIITRGELVNLVSGWLGKHTELFLQFRSFLGCKDSASPELVTPSPTPTPVPVQPKERVNELINELDFNSLKRYGASYRALPKSCQQAKCSGRTDLCREVLNDVWVSFPTWSEGDTQFSSSRKTQFEEQIFRCEDERFELDAVLEANLSTVRVFESIQRRMEQMTPEELSSFQLDEALGGDSRVIHRKAIHRIYGDRACDIIEGLKRSPSVAIPIVLRRLKAKQEEWQEAQRGFNKVWREQLEKYYLKSLDHQGITFKASDSRSLRSKSLISEIETICDERQDQNMDATGPHMTFAFLTDPKVFGDAISLLLFYLYNNTTLQGADRMKVKSFLFQFLHEFFFLPGRELTGDEDDLLEDSGSEGMEVETPMGTNPKKLEETAFMTEEQAKTSKSAMEHDQHVMYCNNTWYAFLRLFQILCERLSKVYQETEAEVTREPSSKEEQNQAPAVLLGLKKPVELEAREYYSAFLDLVKCLLEGNIDNNTFDDSCREILGVHAYITFTLDKVIQGIMRMVQPIALEPPCNQLAALYLDCLGSSMTGTAQSTATEANYQSSAEAMMMEDNCYKVVVSRSEKTLSFELLDIQVDLTEALPETKHWKDYISKFTKPGMELEELQKMPAHRKIFLARNRRCWAEEGGYSGGSDDDEESHNRPHKAPQHYAANQVYANLVIHGDIEFKMDQNSYRMVPLSNCEDYMYRTGALGRAKPMYEKVSSKQLRKFSSWHQLWVSTHVPTEEMQACDHWLQAITLGQPGLASKKTPEAYAGRTRNRYFTAVLPTPFTHGRI